MHDAHNHLHCFPWPESVVQDAHQPIRPQMATGLHPDDWPLLANLHQRFPDRIIPAFGVHPWLAQSLPLDWANRLHEMLASHPMAAVGECGVDRTRCPLTSTQQTELLETHAQLARNLRRGLVLHVVRAWDLAAPILNTHSNQMPVLLHAFSPRGLTGQPWKRWNAWFSFRSETLALPTSATADLIKSVPPDRLLIESDIHPSNTPGRTHWERAKSRLVDSVSSLASILGKAPEEIEARTDANFTLWCAACREPSTDSA